MKKKPTKQVKAKLANSESEAEQNANPSFSIEGQVERLSAITDGQSKAAADLHEELVTYEKIIKDAEKQFEEVGRALNRINEGQLYKGQFIKFEDYCKRKWDMADKHAYRLISSYKAMDTLRGANIEQSLLPRNEYQVRKLLELSDESKWEKDWRKVLKAAKDDPSKVTGSLVIRTLSKVQANDTPKATRAEVLTRVLHWIKKDKEKLTDLEAAKKLLEKIEKAIESLKI